MTDFLRQLAQCVGESRIVRAPEKLAAYTADTRARYASECIGVALPGDAQQVAEVVRCCAAHRVGIVPQGGNTGVVGGAVAHRKQLIVNLARMNQPPAVDALNYTMTAQAGCILADIQRAAGAHQRFFPLSLGAQGSCQIGGNLATNAGGINVLHYGNARDLTLGLEVVLADGRIWDGMNSLRKNNSGYDLRNLFIGSEGTLGIITAATLKLFPQPRARIVALVGLRDADSALTLLDNMRDASGDRLVTCELMSAMAVQSAIKHIAAQTDPMAGRHAWYVLLAVNDIGGDVGDDHTVRNAIERRLADALARDDLQDAVIAADETQAQKLLMLREYIVDAQQFEGGSIKHDVAVPVASVPEFLRRAERAVLALLPNARPYPYGHLGDGNMHFNISQPIDMPRDKFLARWDSVNRVVHDIADELNGTFSAEHGVGIARLDDMLRYKDEVSLDLYRRVKAALDPQGLFNAGKVNPPVDS